jgi:hypothetical protein
MTNGIRKILRFRWLPVEGGIYTLAVHMPELTPNEQFEIDRIARKVGAFYRIASLSGLRRKLARRS